MNARTGNRIIYAAQIAPAPFNLRNTERTLAAYRPDATQDATHQTQASGQPAESKPQAISPLPIPTVLGEAKKLCDAGFNAFLIPVVGMEYGGCKPPFGKTSVLFTTRLGYGDFIRLFQDANLAVMTGRLRAIYLSSTAIRPPRLSSFAPVSRNAGYAPGYAAIRGAGNSGCAARTAR